MADNRFAGQRKDLCDALVRTVKRCRVEEGQSTLKGESILELVHTVEAVIRHGQRPAPDTSLPVFFKSVSDPQPSYWPMLQELVKVHPSHQTFVERIISLTDDHEQRCLLWIKLSIQQGCLSAHISLLATNSKFLAFWYWEWSIVRDSALFNEVIRTLATLERTCSGSPSPLKAQRLIIGSGSGRSFSPPTEKPNRSVYTRNADDNDLESVAARDPSDQEQSKVPKRSHPRHVRNVPIVPVDSSPSVRQNRRYSPSIKTSIIDRRKSSDPTAVLRQRSPSPSTSHESLPTSTNSSRPQSTADDFAQTATEYLNSLHASDDVDLNPGIVETSGLRNSEADAPFSIPYAKATTPEHQSADALFVNKVADCEQESIGNEQQYVASKDAKVVPIEPQSTARIDTYSVETGSVGAVIDHRNSQTDATTEAAIHNRQREMDDRIFRGRGSSASLTTQSQSKSSNSQIDRETDHSTDVNSGQNYIGTSMVTPSDTSGGRSESGTPPCQSQDSWNDEDQTTQPQSTSIGPSERFNTSDPVVESAQMMHLVDLIKIATLPPLVLAGGDSQRHGRSEVGATVTSGLPAGSGALDEELLDVLKKRTSLSSSVEYAASFPAEQNGSHESSAHLSDFVEERRASTISSASRGLSISGNEHKANVKIAQKSGESDETRDESSSPAEYLVEVSTEDFLVGDDDTPQEMLPLPRRRAMGSVGLNTEPLICDVTVEDIVAQYGTLASDVSRPSHTGSQSTYAEDAPSALEEVHSVHSNHRIFHRPSVSTAPPESLRSDEPDSILLHTPVLTVVGWSPLNGDRLLTEVYLKPKSWRTPPSYRCAGCGELRIASSRGFRFCSYFGKFFCRSCHNNDTAVIPARVLKEWSFDRHYVSKFAKQVLDSFWSDPVFDVDSLDRVLLTAVGNIGKVERMREKLVLLTDYLKQCRNGGVLLRDVQHMHWIETPQMYSLNDWCGIKDGSMTKTLRSLVTLYRDHVLSCELCTARGFICEGCEDQKPIFPFQLGDVCQCRDCGALFHKSCYVPGVCGKCTRIANTRVTKPTLHPR